jgi:hypothetical protein
MLKNVREKSKNTPDDSFFEDRHIEVDEQSHRTGCKFHVGDKLGFVDRKQFFNGFQF